MQRYLFHQLGLPAIGMILILVLAGCAPEAEKPLEEVNYRLKWLYNISVVGDLYALDSGLFTKHGLTVDVKPGGLKKTPSRSWNWAMRSLALLQPIR